MRTYPKNNEPARAWTLIELIGVLAVIAILAAVLLPALIRQMDRAVADQETATLQSLGDGLRQYVVTTWIIPDQTTWYSAIASKLGISTNDVLYNAHQQSHQQSRVFLIDEALKMGWGTNVLPYYQTNYVTSAIITSPGQPVSPRLMIVSSLGKALPVSSGVLNAAYFSNLWNAADGTVPSGAPWAGWTGNAADVVVQRINLSPLFVHLLLGRYTSVKYGYYSIDGDGGTLAAIPVVTADGYYIQGSVLGLYSTNGGVANLDAKQILTKDSSFVYEQDIWRGSISGSQIGGAGNIGDVAQQFMDALPNVHAANTNGNAQQLLIINDMMRYMSNYNVWASSGYPSPGSMKTYLQSLEQTMMSDIQGIYVANAGGGNNYFPTNPAACAQ